MFRKKWVPFVLVLAMAASLAGCGGNGEGGSSKALDTAGLTLGREVTTLVRGLTDQLSGIHDLASAQAALPQLQGMESKFNELATKAKDLSPESKDALAGMVKGVMPELEAQATKLGEMPGVGDAIMPTVNALLAKVRNLS